MPQEIRYPNETLEQFELRQLRQKAGVTEAPFHKWTTEQTVSWQKFLEKNKYYVGPAEIDGIAGPKTQAAYYRYMAQKPNLHPDAEGIRGAGWFGKDKEGNRRTPVRDAVDKIADWWNEN